MKESPAAARYAAEFIGTFLLVFTIACNVYTESVATALSVGFVLMATVYALGPVSGAHFNPAVTCALGLAGVGGLGLRGAAWYMVFQALGGVAGALLYWHVIGRDLLLRPLGVYSGTQAAAVEVLYTAALCYVYLGVLSGGRNGHFGLAIGCTLSAAVVAAGPISGCSLNPAVALGSMALAHLAHGPAALQYYCLYTCTPFAGAVLGALLFHGAGGGTAPPEAAWQSSGEEACLRGPRPLRAPSAYATMEQPAATSLRVVRHSPMTLPRDISEHPLFFGCRWQMRPEARRGVPVETCDIDLACVKFNHVGDCVGGVYFAEANDIENNIRHSGDEVIGTSPTKALDARKSDDELIRFRLSDVSPSVQSLVFIVMIYTPGQSFGDLRRIFVRLVDESSGRGEICHYDKEDLAKDANALIAAMLYRQGDAWVFRAVDESFTLPAHSTYRKLIPEMKELCRQVNAADPGNFWHSESARTV